MDGTHKAIMHAFRVRGFRPAYESSAIAILAHPDYPGTEVRVGTVYVVLERDGQEIYRARHDEFDIAEALRRLPAAISSATKA